MFTRFCIVLVAIAFTPSSASHVLALDHLLQLPQPLNHLQARWRQSGSGMCHNCTASRLQRCAGVGLPQRLLMRGTHLAPPHLWAHEGGGISRHGAAAPRRVVQPQHVFNGVEQQRGRGAQVVHVSTLQLGAWGVGQGKRRVD